MARVRLSSTSLESWDEVDRCLQQIGEIDRELQLLAAAQQESIDKIKADTKAAAEPLQGKKAGLELAIQRYAENNRSEFRHAKTKFLTFGSVGFRLSTRVVFKRSADVVKALKDLGLSHCLHTKEDPNKEAMKALPIDVLAECGASLRTEDVFGYEISREKLAEVA